MRNVILTVALIALSSASRAENATKPEYDVPGMPYYCTTSPFGEVCQHLLGGRNTRIFLPSMPDEPCANKTVQLYQLSDRLAAPVGAPVNMSCAMAVLDIPAVKERTYFRVMRERAKDEADTADNKRDAVIAVYPAEQFTALKEWSEKNRLVVFDRTQKLTPFLEKQGITYSSVMPPESKDTTLKTLCLFVPASESDTAPETCPAQINFYERIDEFPQVVSTQGAHGKRLDVFIPLLSTLGYHPLTNRMFIKLIESSLAGELL
jgi:hypothetical protein